MKMTKIAIIIPYYGEFPWYFKFFLHSVSYNPCIEIIIFTDLTKPDYCPGNVHFVGMSLSEIESLASRKLNLKTKIDVPYKLCDFRPAYGCIFSDYISDYDFWGFGDIDVIYGNIQKFITEELLASYDFISVRSDYVTGFFSLVRNTETMNTFFMRSKDYVRVFTNSEHFRFDECSFPLYALFRNGVSIYNVNWENEIESMTYLVKKANDEKLIRALFRFFVIEGAYGKMKWHKGNLIYNNKYIALLYHLIDFKKICPVYEIEYHNITDLYFIDSNRIQLGFRNNW
jgi:hypothetical protein